MTLANTLDLLYLIIGIAVLWIAAMLTWLLFETALILRNANRVIAMIRQKMEWIGDTIEGIGGKLESSSSYINAIAQGGKMVAEFMKKRKSSRYDEDDDDDEDEDEPPRRKSKRRR